MDRNQTIGLILIFIILVWTWNMQSLEPPIEEGTTQELVAEPSEKMFKNLAKNEINILAISTSEIKISVLIDEKHTNIAVKSLHEVYNL